jgi:hypothetical protein
LVEVEFARRLFDSVRSSVKDRMANVIVVMARAISNSVGLDRMGEQGC